MLKTIIGKMWLSALVFLVGCGSFSKNDPLLEKNPYELNGRPNLAFYGIVIDKDTRKPPEYPVHLALKPDGSRNHVIGDSGEFFIQDTGFDQAGIDTLFISVQDYVPKSVPLKYVKGKAQKLGTIELENNRVKLQVFHQDTLEYTNGPGLIENTGWSISAFLGFWKSFDQPFGFENVEQYVKDNLPAGSAEISAAEINQVIDRWLREGSIKPYGRKTYVIQK